MRIAAICITSLLAAAFFISVMGSKPNEVCLASYTSPLQDRVNSQKANAYLALEKIDGAMIGPGKEFSFNATVGTWSRDAGYKKAPVSFNGQLVWTYGGGVCQTSSTLYNAALLSGMEIVERHKHRFAPGYVPPGRDAAVAYSNIDLKFRNPYSWPVVIRAREENGRLVCEFFGKEKPKTCVEIVQELREVYNPRTLIGGENSSRSVMNPGKAGFSVATFRIFREGTQKRTELLSEDSYPSMNRVVAR